MKQFGYGNLPTWVGRDEFGAVGVGHLFSANCGDGIVGLESQRVSSCGPYCSAAGHRYMRIGLWSHHWFAPLYVASVVVNSIS
jgi:hypothetical protein